MNKFKTKEENQKERLDVFLSKKTKTSRSQIQKTIDMGLVFVNKKNKKPNYKLKEGDIITIKEKKELKKKTNKKIRIVKEDKNFLIINKQSGLVVHGAPHIKEEALTDLLVKKYPKIKKIGDNKERPGIVHRLDKDVSGLMMVALDVDFFNYIKKQFQERKIKKIYSVLVYGVIKKNEDEITLPMRRSSGGYKMAALPKSSKEENLREAITKFKVTKRFKNYTLLDVEIKTGRTHQIRVHLLSYGRVVVGDTLYNTKKTRELNSKLNPGRIFLHSKELSFIDQEKEKQTFKIDLPQKLKDILKRIK